MPRVRRIVTSRSGGASAAPYASFNLGLHVGDDPTAVHANRSRLARATGLGLDRLRTAVQALLDHRVERACFGFICDAETAAQAHEAGVGSTIDVKLGGKSDRRIRSPLAATAYVKGLTDGRFRLSFYAPGLQVDLGRTARLRIDGVDVIVVSRVQQTFDPEVFLLHGVDVTRCRVIALKSSHHFRAGFRDLATAIITADSESGLTTQRIERLRRRAGMLPTWPIDVTARYGEG